MIETGKARGLFDVVFPAIPETISLHLVPGEALVFCETVARGKIGAGKTQLRLPAITKINAGAADLLSRCHGDCTATDVLRDFASHHQLDFRTVEDHLMGFLQQATQVGHVELLPEPMSRPPRITGSSDFWMPTNACIELTARCNLRCKHCYRESGAVQEQALGTEDLVATLQHLADSGVRIVELTGGEPLLRKDFFDIFDFCIENMSSVALLTNGCLVREEIADRLAEHRDKMVVSVSIDSWRPDFHDRFRGVSGSHAKACRAVRLLSERGVVVRVGMSVVPENAHEIEATLELARSLGAPSFAYNPVLPFGRGRDTDWSTIATDELVQLHATERRIIEHHGDMLVVLEEGFEKALVDFGNCGAGSRSVTIDPEGWVRICQLADGEYFTLGNLSRSPLIELMSSDKARFFRALRPPTPNTCGDCRFVPFCRYCSLRGLTAFSSRKPDCPWAAENHLAPLPDTDPGLSTAACSIYNQSC